MKHENNAFSSQLPEKIVRAPQTAICPLCTSKVLYALLPDISRPDNRICPSCGLVFQPRRDSSIEDLASCYAGDGYWNAETVKLSRFTRISVLDDVDHCLPGEYYAVMLKKGV